MAFVSGGAYRYEAQLGSLLFVPAGRSRQAIYFRKGCCCVPQRPNLGFHYNASGHFKDYRNAAKSAKCSSPYFNWRAGCMVYDSAPAWPLQPQTLHGISLQVVCIETPWRWNCCGAVWPEGLSPLEQCGVFFESLLEQGYGGQVAAGECRRAEGFQPKAKQSSRMVEAPSWSEGSEGIFDLLLQPGPDLHKACQVLFSDQWRSGSLEVLLLYQEGLFEWLPAFRWLLAEVLPAMSAPLHIRQLKVSNTTMPEKLPVFAAALVVVVAYHKVHHFDFSAYARYARSQGTEMLGLLHLGHEVQWETEGEIEDLGSWGTIRADGARVRQKRDSSPLL